MATRTAVSHAYANLQNAALIRVGADLIWTFTHSAEDTCSRCLPWLQIVLSLTGETTGDVQVTLADGTLYRAGVQGNLTEARSAGSGIRTAGAAGSPSSTAGHRRGDDRRDT